MSILTALGDRFSHARVLGRRIPRCQGRFWLSDHTQTELGAVEAYERSHQDRQPVLDMLRWMRGSAPLPGYDALSVEDIITALKTADSATIKMVRGYERKFANRPEVLDEVVGAQHRDQLPACQPTSSQS